jgi:hypothetical protein
MIRKLDEDRLNAELVTLEAILAELDSQDYLSRIGLESRRVELRASLARLREHGETQARVALFFGGDPVVGSEGVKARFAGDAVGSFQDMLTNVWGSQQERPVASAGPIRNQELSNLHITALLHGSVGFLLEELDPGGQTLFESPLKNAADQAAQIVGGFAAEDDQTFAAVIEELSPRVFKSVQKFLRCVHTDRATIRLVEGDVDLNIGHDGIERAWQRAEESKVDEERVYLSGSLIGVIPIHRRFEFQPDGASMIFGIVGEDFSQSFLERMTTEQFIGKRWRGFFHKKLVEKIGRPPVDRYTLLRLEDETTEPQAGPLDQAVRPT